jgi:hypothetical protein
MDHVTGKVWFAFLGAPIAWSAALLVGYALVAHGCYPSSDPLDFAGGYGWRYASGVVTGVMLIIALSALTLAWRLVTTTPDGRIGVQRAFARAEAGGVPRYLAVAGLLIGLVFTALIVFNAVALILEPTCRFA